MFELQITVKSGDRCAVCSIGTLSLCGRVPVFGKPGKSRCHFQCSACASVKSGIQDDRFICSDGIWSEGERAPPVGEAAVQSRS
jgi:hypothetical protein